MESIVGTQTKQNSSVHIYDHLIVNRNCKVLLVYHPSVPGLH
jgi:hypothetical protein